MDNEKFGNFIKELRKEKGLTQKELGEKLNITDKAISKWERGLSFPDISMLNSLTSFFEIDVSELLNGERGIKQEIDIDTLIKEAIEKYKNIEEKRKEKINKIKKIIGIFFLLVFGISSIIQITYIAVLKKHNYEYVIDILFYIINEIIIISALFSSNLLITKLKKVITYILAIIFSVINIAFMINNGFDNKCIVSFSKDFSNEVVLKVEKSSGTIKLYRYPKGFLFAKEKEQFSYELKGRIKVQWLTTDICGLTYKDKNNNLREYVVTFGTRSDDLSYYNIFLLGNWQVSNQYGIQTGLLVDSKGITISQNGEKELFELSDIEQFGTMALVLYKNEKPRYVIALDENCEIDRGTGIIKNGGTITLSEVSMEKTILQSLYCMTYKDEDLSDYNVASVAEYDYSIKNGILYIRFDNKEILEVPGDFSEMKGMYNKYNYQISDEKTVFYYLKDKKRFLVYSDDKGKTWNTVEIENKSSIESIQFINSNVGFMFKIEDVAMGIAFGEISKTMDGGKTWQNVFYGIGNEDEKVFSRASRIKFFDENIGFLTMPNISGIDSEIYITKDGGNNFEILNILEDDIYDYYNLPTFEDGKLYIKISQGTDGDYNGGDFKTYYSEDNGSSWKYLE